MPRIAVTYFTDEVDMESVEEHIVYDASEDYLVVRGAIINLYSSQNGEYVPFVDIKNIDNVIKALTYIKSKYPIVRQ